MKYLLDANAVIKLLNDKNSDLSHRAHQHKTSDIGISAIISHELFYGAYTSKRAPHNVALVDSLPFEVLGFDKEDARQAGEARSILMTRGMPIGPYDILIAGQAKARKLTLITHNVKEFKRVPGLKVEDWEA